MAYAAFEYRALRRHGAGGARTYLVLVGTGTLAAVLIYVVL